jgi:hypothetical protein
MKNALGYLGTLIFVSALGCCLFQFGNHWTCGRYFLPRSLVNETGMQYSDDSMIDGLTLAAIKADVEEEVFLGLLCILGGIFALVKYQNYRDRVKQRKAEIEKLKQRIIDLIFKTGECNV